MNRLALTIALSCVLAGTWVLCPSAACGEGEHKAPSGKAAPDTPEQETREPDVVFVPTPQDVVEKMLELARVTKNDVLYDLGCGDGRIVVTAAKKYGCRSVGFDIDPRRVKESKENVKKNKVEKLASIRQQDIFKLDLSEATVITLYLLPELNVRLIPQLEKLKPGSRIVSHDFRMRGVKPEKVIRMKSKHDNNSHRIYFWTTPLKQKKKARGKKKERQVVDAVLSP